jgi:hypothetical protein
VDWSPLRGRRCILWPDFDLQTDDVGQTLPYAQQPGMIAMITIAGILRGLDPEAMIKIIAQQPGHPGGWDVADAILIDGWDLPRIIAFIKQYAAAPVDVRAIKTKHTPRSAAATIIPVTPPAPRCPLGRSATAATTAITSRQPRGR